MDVWVVGAGGLLGSAISRTPSPDSRYFAAGRVPWHSPAESGAALRRSLADFHRWRRPGHPWGIIWAAGSGVIASTPEKLASESAVLLDFATAVAGRPEPGGAVFFASSASVFGGTGRDLFDERTAPAPLNAYARTKLTQELRLTTIFDGALPLAIGRISTLYGPGQNLAKGQGLISSMCSEALRRRTISIYVPLDTTRDYLYTQDAAVQVLALTERAAVEATATAMMRVVASHRPTTVGELARMVQAVAHRRTPILQIRTSSTVLHARCLALTSTDPSMRSFRPTPLPVGIDAVYRDLLQRYLSAA